MGRGNIAAVMAETGRLSAPHTLVGVHRSFDILHVAAPVLFKATIFLSFNANQRALAEAAGLEVS